MSLPPFTILAHGMLGYGFPLASLEEAERRGFDLIAIDAGSTDPGPFYLGSGRPFISRTMVERDLELLLAAARRAGARLIVGSAGGAGTRDQLGFVAAIVRDIVARQGWTGARLATIDSELDRETVTRALDDGRIVTFETERALTRDDIGAARHIVAQIGLEPIVAALSAGADIVVSGRAWDVANFAALPIARGYPAGLALHLGKILECGAQAALPVEGSDLLLGTLDEEGFVVEPLNPAKACTVASVAAHTLYEKSNPVLLPGPGGLVDLTAARFAAVDDRRVRVTGSAFHPAAPTVKLEGARLVGHRHVAIAGLRDPIMIGQIDGICAGVAERLARNLAGQLEGDDYALTFRRYGIDGVMGALEPKRDELPHEVGLVIDVVGRTPEIAETVCAMARSLMLHWGYPGRKATAGNLAIPFSPADFAAGEVYEFTIYHLLAVDDPTAVFPFALETL